MEFETSTRSCARSPVIAPEILLALWLYGTLRAVGSALARSRIDSAASAGRPYPTPR
ncbi:MAG: hypothetical protein HUU27_00020 [Phycisphaerae bacterium]|nr:hypothetical protein [Phycisphaerae bacterium]